MIQTVFVKQDQLLKSIFDLHLGGSGAFLDLTYGSGAMHAGKLQRPELCYDIEPRELFVHKKDCRRTELDDDSIDSIIFDPPFLAGGGKTSVMHSRYSSFPTMTTLLQFYGESLDEIRRILKPGGVLIFKCQDINNGKTQGFSHCDIYTMATQRGLYALDLFILTNKNRMPPPKLKKQVHARKSHCYFWVFKKCRRRNHGTR